ncbi:MAG TPA: sigma factor-like helix-turn-helix DNA-binding protein [Kofleriaceae bacterium]
MTTRWKPRHRARVAAAALQPVEASGVDPRLEERLARLEADKELALRLGLLGYAGPEWDAFVRVLVEYGIQVFRAWLRTGKVFTECRHTGPRRRLRDGDEIDEITGEIVAEAIAAFRKDVLIPGTWDPSKGASLRTYFIGNCKLRFANVYRRWVSETSGIPVDDGTIRAELEHQRAVRVPVEVTAELRRLAPRLRDDTIERINALGAVGYTNAEIAEIDGTTEGAINARLHRAREKMNQ